MGKTDCSRCGSTLEPTRYGPPEWRCCPNCEPQMFPNLVPAGFALVPTAPAESLNRSRRLSARQTETE